MKSFKAAGPQVLALALAVPWVVTGCQNNTCVAPAPGDENLPPTILETGCVDPANPTEPAEGVFRYTVAQTFWSDGAAKDRWFSVPAGTKVTMHEDGQWELPVGAVTIKHFRDNGKLFETRFYVRDAEDSFHGYTYEWNSDETDATLVASDGKAAVDIGATLPNWDYPSRSQCNDCHNPSENYFLGFQTRQLNTEAHPDSGFSGNQLEVLARAGVLQTQLSSGEIRDGLDGVEPQSPYAPQPGTSDWNIDDVVAAGPAALDHEARSYLAVNCGYCHNESNPRVPPFFDASYDVPLQDSRMCDPAVVHRPQDNPDDLRIEPGSPANSRIFQRQATRGPGSNQMPPLATHNPDILGGSTLLFQWIANMNECRDPMPR